MEIPRSLGIQDNEEEEEYDSVFYEDIEAPKFVDLTAPDAACPADDPSWFCLRVGKQSSSTLSQAEPLTAGVRYRI